MSKPISIGVAAALALSYSLACGSGRGARRPSPDELITGDPLPLALGAKWTYTATVTQYDSENDKDVATQLTWTTEVVGERAGDGFTAYDIKGWPSDLATSDGRAPAPSQRTLLRSDGNFLWEAEAAAGQNEPTVEGAEGWFSWPVVDGQRICPNPSVVYCWTVATTEDGWELTYRTGPDEETYLLQPGTGVATYHYAHHGTTNEVIAKLVDYKPGKPRTK